MIGLFISSVVTCRENASLCSLVLLVQFGHVSIQEAEHLLCAGIGYAGQRGQLVFNAGQNPIPELLAGCLHGPMLPPLPTK